MRATRPVLGLIGLVGLGLFGLTALPEAVACEERRAQANQSGQAAAPRTRTLMAIFAHPDDEQVVSPLLARYAREGVRVLLVIAADGRYGVNDFAGIPAGEALAKARAKEAACAAEKLHIEPPILLDFHDITGLAPTGEPNGEAVMKVVANHERLATEVVRLFGEHRPDVVITWGPDGVTGHTDHRLVSAVVTQAFQRGGDAWPRQLYYAGFPAERLATATLPPGVRLFGVAMRYLTVRVPYSEGDLTAARESLACHRSQYTPQMVDSMIQLSKQLGAGTTFLRPWTGAAEISDDLFAKN